MGWWRAAIVFGVGLVLAARAVAADPAAAPGMRAYVDPATGQLLDAPPVGVAPEPTPAPLDRSGAGLAESPAPGGGVMLDLQGRFQDFSYVRLGPDGRWVFGCTEDASSLRRALATQAKPAPALEDR
jgi:hypothetical protein